VRTFCFVPRCPVCDRRIRADAACPWDGGRVEPRPVDAPATPLLPGVVIERLVGVGGGGAVWAGQRGGEPVAVKMAHTGSPLMHARFAREAEAMRRVGPPAALRLLETGVLDERPYLVMELATHRTLADELAALEEPPPAAWVLARGAALLDALEAVHRAGVVHRDLKPEHVILPPGRARLLDFGLALEPQHSADPRLTAAGTVAGTPHYMAPEQLRDDAIDARADIYAFGVIFYEMLTLRPPFTGDEGSIAHGHLMLRPPPPARGDAPPGAGRCGARLPGETAGQPARVGGTAPRRPRCRRQRAAGTGQGAAGGPPGGFSRRAPRAGAGGRGARLPPSGAGRPHRLGRRAAGAPAPRLDAGSVPPAR
jgi:serine/threonine protein kinase